MLDITNIPPPRVPLIDERTGLMSREWYRFFLNLFRLTGNGTNDTSLEDIQLAPKAQVESGDLEDVYIQSQLAGPAAPELGTLAAENEDNVRSIGFSTNPSPAVPNPAPTGTVYWNGGTTLNVQMTPNVIGHVNESAYYYIKASSAITKGDVVMFTGAVGASGVPTGAPATGITDGSYIMGIAAESIALNGFGMVQFLGTLKGLDTSAFADGDILWYNPAVTGGLTKTKPIAPNVKVQMAAVINAGSGGSGSILIRVNSGSELGGTDSNVQFGTLADGNIIQYDGTAGYWKNIATLGTANGGTGLTSFTNKGVVYANSTTTLTTSSGLQFDGTSLLIGTSSAVSGSKFVIDAADATIYGITVGRGAGAITTNTAVGLSALNANTTGSSNTALGHQSLNFNQAGSSNTAIGAQAGYNCIGTGNTFVGRQAGFSNNTAGNTFNTFVGYFSGYNTTGSSNTFLGEESGQLITSGGKNTVIGRHSGNQDGVDIRTANNNIVLSDGDGNARQYYDGANNFWAWRNSGTERMRITSAGNIYGTSGTTGMTDGFFYIPAAAGVPTGVPTAVSGCVPMYYDTTNNKFYVYNGAWKSVALT